MLKVNLSRQSAKFIKKLSTKHARQVAAKITQLISNTKMFATNSFYPPKSPLIRGTFRKKSSRNPGN